MKRLLLSTALALFATGALAGSLTILDGTGATQHLGVGSDPSTSTTINNYGSSYALTNPTSTLTLPATTTAYGAATQMGSPGASLTIPNTAGGFYLPALLLTTNDPAWGGAVVQIDTWRAAPTLTNGDRGAYLVATGSTNFLGSYSCTLTAGGDGSYSACAPTVGTTPAIRLVSGTSVFWTAQAVTGTTGTTVASGVFTLTAELSN